MGSLFSTPKVAKKMAETPVEDEGLQEDDVLLGSDEDELNPESQSGKRALARPQAPVQSGLAV